MPSVITVLVLLALAILLVAATRSYERPYNIIGESYRQTVLLLRTRPQWLFYSFVIYLVQMILPIGLFSAPISVVGKIAGSIVLQALFIFVLAHIALRLHRGLIRDEWPSFPISGARERRMALYVLLCWAIVGVVGQLPFPVISEDISAVLGTLVSLLTLATKAALATCGPAASLDDPQPLRRAIASFRRAPVTVLTVVFVFQFIGDTIGQVFAVADHFSGHAWIVGLLSRPVTLVAQTFFFAMSEFALVILLTRIWENQYEPETRYAAHNLGWV